MWRSACAPPPPGHKTRTNPPRRGVKKGRIALKKFMGNNFLLENDTARTLYHDYAAKMPIIDYHCHISPREIA